MLKNESSGIDEKIQKLLESEDAHQKIEAIRNMPLTTAPKISNSFRIIPLGFLFIADSVEHMIILVSLYSLSSSSDSFSPQQKMYFLKRHWHRKC